jgi:hypothetical protein
VGVFRTFSDPSQRTAVTQPSPRTRRGFLADANRCTVARPAGEIRQLESIFRQFRRWADSGVWDVILEALAGSGVCDATLQMIDASIIRAHHCAGEWMAADAGEGGE